MKLLTEGAEAKIYLDQKKVIKSRFAKRYRIKEIDIPLRKTRTRIESKILAKLPKEVFRPEFIGSDEKSMTIKMSFLKGNKIRDILDDNISICTQIGEKVALIHNSGIIHGDLTTSNMIFSSGKVYFIDFGLSYFSEKIEDKAVDLHLLRQALGSKHYKISEKAFKLVTQGYAKKSKNQKLILERLVRVENRGRNKGKEY